MVALDDVKTLKVPVGNLRLFKYSLGIDYALCTALKGMTRTRKQKLFAGIERGVEDARTRR